MSGRRGQAPFAAAGTGVPAACVALLVAASGCFSGPSSPSPKSAQEEKLPPQVTLIGVKLRGWEGSDLVSVGRAAKLTYDRSSSNFEADEALVQFPSRSSDARSRRQVNADLELRAPIATGNLQTRQADGKGGVTARSASGVSARTEAAHFDGIGLVANGSTPVDVRGPGYSLSADGFQFYFGTEELLFTGNVHSRLGGEPTK